MKERTDKAKFFRKCIIQMLKEIDNPEFLEKIHNYVVVPHRIEKKKKA